MYEVFVGAWPHLFEGVQLTLLLTVISIISGTAIAIFLALGKTYGPKYVKWPINVFIELIRGTPLLAQLFILYFGLPPYGIKLSGFLVAYIGFTMNCSAYTAEYIRGSIMSIESNQLRVAESLGMTKWQGIFNVILPQALRRVVPSWTNEFIYLLKYTSLAYMIGTHELMTQAKFFASRNYEFFKVYLIVALFYLVIVVFFTQIFSWVESKFTIPGFEVEH
ncbi:MAG TPA: amino acid ABC transporter permease [Halanaerobiales bacterium]|nr:amino acid ABC transporter permease [Halanaerobiales bacterium]